MQELHELTLSNMKNGNQRILTLYQRDKPFQSCSGKTGERIKDFVRNRIVYVHQSLEPLGKYKHRKHNWIIQPK